MEQKQGMSNITKIIIIAVAATFVAAAVSVLVVIFAVKKDEIKLSRQLRLAQKYLEDLEYDQAIASFESALKIDPRCVDAYLGLAEAYEGKGDYVEASVTILNAEDIVYNERIVEKKERLVKSHMEEYNEARRKLGKDPGEENEPDEESADNDEGADIDEEPQAPDEEAEIFDEVRDSRPQDFKIQIYDMVFQAGTSLKEVQRILETSSYDFSMEEVTGEYDDGVEEGYIAKGYHIFRIRCADGWWFDMGFCDFLTVDGELCDNALVKAVMQCDDRVKEHMYFFGGVKLDDPSYTYENLVGMGYANINIDPPGNTWLSAEGWHWGSIICSDNFYYYYTLMYDDDGIIKRMSIDLMAD